MADMRVRRQILLAEVTPKIPQAPVFATWNPADAAITAALSGGNLTLSKSDVHASTWAGVRSTVAITSGVWYYETLVLFTGAADFGVGVAIVSFSLSSIPGADVVGRSIAVTKSGAVKFQNTTVASLGAIASGSTIRMRVDYDAQLVFFAVNGGAWALVVVPDLMTGAVLYPLAAVHRPVGTNPVTTARFGASAFSYTVTAGVNPGVYSTPASVPVTLYLGSEGFNTGSADTPKNKHYMGRIAGDQDFETEREASCDVWGGQTVNKPGQLSVINNDGALNAWREYDWRDAPIVIYRGDDRSTRAGFAEFARGRVDVPEFTAGRRIVLRLTDALAALDRASQTQTYPASQEVAQAAGQPLPWLWGRPLYCPAVWYSSAAGLPNYQVQQDTTAFLAGFTSLDSIAQVYDRGDLFAGPDDPYSVHNPITTATTGGAGGGAFTTWAADAGGVSMPFNWTRIGVFGVANDRFINSFSSLRCQSGGQSLTRIFHSTSSLTAGKRYTIAFSVGTVTTAGAVTFRLQQSAEVRVDRQYVISTTGAKSITIDVIETAQLQIVLGETELDVTIDNLTVSSVQIVDWTYLPTAGAAQKTGFRLANVPAGRVVCNPVGPLDGKGAVVEFLPDVVPYIIGRLAQPYGVTAPTYSAADLEAIDASAHYRTATFTAQPKTLLTLLREVLDCFTGWAVPDRTGQLRFGRITEPSDVADLTITPAIIAGAPEIETDTAKNLTTRLGGRRNHAPHGDGDIASSVSAALRRELTSELGCIREGAPQNTTDPVSEAYAAAIAAPVRPTLLQEAANIQAESSRRATLWRKTRAFYRVPVILGASTADALEPGQTVRLVWPKLGIDKNLLVVGVRSRFFARLVYLKLWG